MPPNSAEPSRSRPVAGRYGLTLAAPLPAREQHVLAVAGAPCCPPLQPPVPRGESPLGGKAPGHGPVGSPDWGDWVVQEDVPGCISHKSEIVHFPQFSRSQSAPLVKAVAPTMVSWDPWSPAVAKHSVLVPEGPVQLGGLGTRCRREHRACRCLKTGPRMVKWPRGRGTVTEAGEAVSAAPRLDLRRQAIGPVQN